MPPDRSKTGAAAQICGSSSSSSSKQHRQHRQQQQHQHQQQAPAAAAAAAPAASTGSSSSSSTSSKHRQQQQQQHQQQALAAAAAAARFRYWYVSGLIDRSIDRCQWWLIMISTLPAARRTGRLMRKRGQCAQQPDQRSHCQWRVSNLVLFRCCLLAASRE